MKKNSKGQALVESAIVFPILVFFLIGVFEVGWALRGYLVLTNANREAARYAARPGYLDNPASVYTHTLRTLAEQIDFSSGVILVQTVEVENYCTNVFTITHPITWGYPYTHSTQIDWPAAEELLKQTQYRSSCDKLRNALVPFPHRVVIVEMWYEQPQLFGFPLISNPLTDPVPMYAHSMFRIGDKRDGN